MGARGPAGLPNNVHAMRGTIPGANRGGEKTKPVTLRPVTPTPPDWLDAEAREEWQRVAPELDAQGLLALVDRGMLVAHCSAWSTMVRCIAELAAVESITGDGAHARARVPEFMAWKDSLASYTSSAAKIFATPTDRLRTRLPEVTDEKADRILD